MTFIIFEGVDCSGKTTTIKEFHKKTNYKYSCIDRFSGTSYAYSLLKKRNLNINEYLKQDLDIFDKAIIIYLEAPDNVIKKRFKSRGEDFITIEEIKKLKIAYEEYLKKTPLYVERINTNTSIEEVIKKIIFAIKKFETEQINNKIIRLENTINIIGNNINNFKEVRDLKLYFSNDNIKNNKYKILEEEKVEFDNIFYSLKNIIRLKLHYFKNQNIYSRQFIYTSDSCISLFHIMSRNNILECYITIRSSNVRKNLISDCYGIYNIAKKINKYFFNHDKIKIIINLNNAHI